METERVQGLGAYVVLQILLFPGLFFWGVIEQVVLCEKKGLESFFQASYNLKVRGQPFFFFSACFAFLSALFSIMDLAAFFLGSFFSPLSLLIASGICGIR